MGNDEKMITVVAAQRGIKREVRVVPCVYKGHCIRSYPGQQLHYGVVQYVRLKLCNEQVQKLRCVFILALLFCSLSLRMYVFVVQSIPVLGQGSQSP